MRSIRTQLLAWLLPGFAVVCVAAGVGVYFSERQAFEADLDARLGKLAGLARLALRAQRTSGAETTRGPTVRVFSTREEFKTPGQYFEQWTAAGAVERKSPNLGSIDLPRPAEFPRDELRYNGTLDNGDRVRVSAVRIPQIGSARPADFRGQREVQGAGQGPQRFTHARGIPARDDPRLAPPRGHSRSAPRRALRLLPRHPPLRHSVLRQPHLRRRFRLPRLSHHSRPPQIRNPPRRVLRSSRRTFAPCWWTSATSATRRTRKKSKAGWCSTRARESAAAATMGRRWCRAISRRACSSRRFVTRTRMSRCRRRSRAGSCRTR